MRLLRTSASDAFIKIQVCQDKAKRNLRVLIFFGVKILPQAKNITFATPQQRINFSTKQLFQK